MAIRKAPKSPGYESAREDTRRALLGAAMKLFSRKGLDGTTVKELAQKAGVNISLISYHFDGKEGLYRACIQECGRERLMAAQKLLQPASTPEEFRLRVHLFIQDVLDYCATHLDHVRMVLRELDSEAAITGEVFENTFLKVFATCAEFVKSGQKAGFVSREVDPYLASSFMHGSLTHLATSDSIRKRYFNQTITDPKYREKVTHQLAETFLSGVLSHPSGKIL